MGKRNKRGKGQPLAPHFVVYDYEHPSPLFTPEQVETIESIRADFSEEDLARIHEIETWILNTNTGWLNSPAIPGLRHRPTNGHRYVKRFSQDRYETMIETFLDQVRYAFTTMGLPCNMPVLRVTLPNGDQFYPIIFHTEMDKWPGVLDEAAAFFGTQLAQFDRGKFVVSNGDIYPFAQIAIDEPEFVPPPQDW